MSSPATSIFGRSPRAEYVVLPLVAATVAALVGLGVAVRPSAAVALVACVVVGTVLVLMPARFLAVAVIVAAALLPSILLMARLRGVSLAATPVAGQARVLTVLAAVCLGRVALSRDRMRAPTVALLALAVFIAATLLTVLTASLEGNVYPGMWSELSRELAYPLAFLIGFIARRSAGRTSERESLYRAMAAAAIAVALTGVAYWAWVRGYVSVPGPLAHIFDEARASSGYSLDRSIYPFLDDSPNLAAVVFVAYASFLGPVLWLSNSTRSRRYAMVLALVVAAAVLATGSRTGLVSFAAALLPIVFLTPGGRHRRRTVLGLAIVAAVVASGYQTFPRDRVLSLHADTLVARQEIWKQAAQRFLEKPLFGYGFHYSTQTQFSEGATSYGSPTGRFASVHNEYLGRLVDGGILGGLLFCLFLLLVVVLARRIFASPGTFAEGVGLSAFLVALVVSMLVGSSLESATVAIMFWLFVGIGAAAAVDRTEAGTERD